MLNNSAVGEFRAVGWEDENGDSAPEDSDGADKAEDIATANIFTNQQKGGWLKTIRLFLLE